MQKTYELRELSFMELMAVGNDTLHHCIECETMEGKALFMSKGNVRTGVPSSLCRLSC